MSKRLKVWLTGLLVVGIGFLMVVVSAYRVSHPNDVFGQEKGQTAITDSTDSAQVDYQLAYPGILPDHPLYWLKMVRDRVWGWLVRQPAAKSEWLLLMADKRLRSAQSLVEAGKNKLAVTTASKAEKYLERSVLKLKEAQVKGKEVNDLPSNLKKATQKHYQVLKNLSEKTKGDEAADLRQLLNYPERLVKEI